MENKEDKVVLYERQSPDVELMSITPDSPQSSNIYYNKCQVIGYKVEVTASRITELPKHTITGAINIDGHNGAVKVTFLDLFGEEEINYDYEYYFTFAPYDYYKVGDEFDELNSPVVSVMIMGDEMYGVSYGPYPSIHYYNPAILPCYIDFSLTTKEDWEASFSSVPKIVILEFPDPRKY